MDCRLIDGRLVGYLDYHDFDRFQANGISRRQREIDEMRCAFFSAKASLGGESEKNSGP